MEKHEGKKPFGRPTCRWEDNINTDFKVVVWEGVDWFHLAQNRERW
jgi:hypothetical protein